ncbi:MAG: GNAT family N-acetyltransferase [Bacilli bacterium]|nr:GNAT family N-acetyltransferase [Bacilli bacterium]
MSKKSYEINFDDIILRRATIDDDFSEIARLIYDTDPYIYPFWFNNNLDEAIKVLVPLMHEEGFIFHYENFYVAYDKENKKIIGICGAIDTTTNLDYDYTNLINVNDNYKFTVDNYLKVLIDEVVEKKYMYLTNICIDTNLRGKSIGKRLLKYFIEQMHEEGFDEIGFDCLMHNLRAKNLYHSLGFKEVSEGFGFDGTNYSTVETVFFKKKSTPYVASDYQMLPNTNVKNNDLKREKCIYEYLNKKKGIK